MIVLDTSVLIDHLRGVKRATKFLLDHEGRDEMVVPALVAWELWRGATTPARAEKVEALLESVTVEPFMPAMAKLAADLHRAMEDAGRKPAHFDLLIAAHAVFHNAPLATLDKDFESFDGLRILRPGG